MADIKSKQGNGSFLALATALLALVALIIYSLNAATQYYNDVNAQVVVMTVLAILFSAAAAILPKFAFAHNTLVKIAVDIMFVMSAVMLIWSFMIFIGDRVESLAYVLGSDLESDNVAAQRGVRQAIAGFVVYFVAWLAVVAGAFSGLKRKTG